MENFIFSIAFFDTRESWRMEYKVKYIKKDMIIKGF